jgi:hypothetical protein
MKIIAIMMLFGIVVFAAGCPALDDDNDRLKTRLAELEQAVNGNKQDQISAKLSDIETEIRGQQVGMEIIKQQLIEANAKNEMVDGRLQAEIAKNMQLQIDYASRHGSAGGAIWPICLGIICAVVMIFVVRALLPYSRGSRTSTIVYLNPQDRDQIIKIMSQNPDTFNLIESRK